MSDLTLSIIIVNWNTRDITRDCLRSVREHAGGVAYEVIVVDNASSDGSAEMIRAEFPKVHLIANDENVGFGRANNQAMRVARGRYFLLLNSDTVIFDDSIQRLVSFIADDPRIGIAGCKLLFEDGTLQSSCSRFPSIRVALLEDLMLYKFLPRRLQGELLLGGYWPHDRARDVEAVWGAAMMVRRRVFEQTGGFDERIFMYGEDLEWCMRVHDRGWRIAFTPEAAIVHLNHKSSEKKYGDERIDLCHKRAYEIYRRRAGLAAMLLMMLIKTFGALVRVSYFGLRAKRKGRMRDYFSAQARVHGRSLRYHLRALSGHKLAIE
ncbi:MAG TPA: glycosyltransferase family 2 protein [Blastocatellia bacterium]|nr:glycosyltransferase family 2 protein [Blastocatellia bacterium]